MLLSIVIINWSSVNIWVSWQLFMLFVLAGKQPIKPLYFFNQVANVSTFLQVLLCCESKFEAVQCSKWRPSRRDSCAWRVMGHRFILGWKTTMFPVHFSKCDHIQNICLVFTCSLNEVWALKSCMITFT